jgi:hypothetical protein
LLGHKGQSSELIDILVIVIVVTVAAFVLAREIIFGSSNLTSIYLKRTNFEKIEDATIQIYNSKISGTDKTLAQMLIDRVVTNDTPVSYGLGFGNIDVDKQLERFFFYYFGNDWFLEVPSAKYTLGNPNVDKKQVITYVINLPYPPTEQVIKAVLYVW